MVTLKGKKEKHGDHVCDDSVSCLNDWMQNAGKSVQTFTGFSQSKADCNCLVRGCLPPGDPCLVIEGVKHPKSLDYQLVGASTHYPVIKREKKIYCNHWFILSSRPIFTLLPENDVIVWRIAVTNSFLHFKFQHQVVKSKLKRQ